MRKFIIKLSTDGYIIPMDIGDKDPFEEAKTVIGCNMLEDVWLSEGEHMLIDEEGKLKGLPTNAAATLLYNHPYDYIVGDTVIVYADDDDFISLTVEEVTHVLEELSRV